MLFPHDATIHGTKEQAMRETLVWTFLYQVHYELLRGQKSVFPVLIYDKIYDGPRTRTDLRSMKLENDETIKADRYVMPETFSIESEDPAAARQHSYVRAFVFCSHIPRIFSSSSYIWLFF